jgi:hypothetical protein
MDKPYRIRIQTTREARQIANLLREGDPPIWVNDAAGRTLALDLRNLSPADAAQVAARISSAEESGDPPREDVPYHDLYWSEERLLRWPD